MGEWYCSQLFKLEQALTELTPEERHDKRLEQEKPVLDALLSWANEMQVKTAPKSALGKAIHYLLEQWPYLTRYLEAVSYTHLDVYKRQILSYEAENEYLHSAKGRFGVVAAPNGMDVTLGLSLIHICDGSTVPAAGSASAAI